MTKYIDQEERDTIESLHREGWQSSNDSTLNKIYEEYAKYSIELNSKIEIFLMAKDLHKIQAKALEEGIPYQAMISMLIHKFNEGKVTISA